MKTYLLSFDGDPKIGLEGFKNLVPQNEQIVVRTIPHTSLHYILVPSTIHVEMIVGVLKHALVFPSTLPIPLRPSQLDRKLEHEINQWIANDDDAFSGVDS